MNEKRFYLDENGIQDREYEFSILREDELVDIINSIVEENEHLKKQISNLYNYFRECFNNVSEESFKESWDVILNDI